MMSWRAGMWSGLSVALLGGLLLGVAAPAEAHFHIYNTSCGQDWSEVRQGFKRHPLFGITTSSSFAPIIGSTTTTDCLAAADPRGDAARVYYVAHSHDTLMREAAQGGGAHLVALAALMGCPVSTYVDFGQVQQRRFAWMYPETGLTPGEYVSRLGLVIATEPRLSACTTTL